jgi:beta-glucosidase
MTFPTRIQDCPAFLHSKADAGRMNYGEGVYVGYRYYEAIELPDQFPFGWGLSYTTFAMSNLRIRVDDSTLSIHLLLTNTGNRSGSEVVQVYIGQRSPTISRPKKELKGFGKYLLQPQESTDVAIRILLKYATSYWNEHLKSWASDAGIYDVFVGSDSTTADSLSSDFNLSAGFTWNGI